MFKTLIKNWHQAICTHSFAFVKSDIIGGRRVAIHICVRCRKNYYVAYSNEYDRDRLFTDMVFSGAGRK